MRVARRLPLGLAFALLLLVLSDAGVWEGSPGLVSADTWECIEYDTDYSLRCPSEGTRCGSFCFYGECLECTDAYHWHPHEHESCVEECEEVCDMDGKCSTVCSTVCSIDIHMHRERHGESPCKELRWSWHLLGEDSLPSSRVDVYNSHNLEASLKFGMVPEGYAPSYPPCVVQVGSSVSAVLPKPTRPSPVPDDRWVGGLSGGRPIPYPEFKSDVPHFTGRVLDSRAVDTVVGTLLQYPVEVGMRDLSHLPNTPGEPGAPLLGPVTKIVGQDTWVKLQASGWGVGTREYRYWSYNGLREEAEGMDFPGFLEASPSEFRVPFEELLSDVVIVVGGLRGILSFQVRSVDPNGDLSANSNIEHQIVGMEGFHSIGPLRRIGLAIDIPLPAPPPTDVPLPTLEVGFRPQRPAIDEVVQIEDVPGEVEVRLSASYSDDVEYRWWPHSGFGPTAAFEVWCRAGVRGGSFRISRVEPKTPEVAGAPSGAVFDFQVRLVNSEGVPGDSSEPAVLLVWGGDYTNWSPRLVITTPVPTVVVPLLTVPVPFTTPRAPGSC